MSKTKKTHWKKLFNYDYLGAYSIESGDLILTIQELKKEMVTSQGGRKEECLVCYFLEKDTKPMIMNKTNCKSIQKVYGTPHIEEWVGKKIQIYVKSGIRFGSDTTDGLRIREFTPKVLSSDETKFKETRRKVINALSVYKGDDKDMIREMLNQKTQHGELTIDFLTQTLNDITNAA